LKHNV